MRKAGHPALDEPMVNDLTVACLWLVYGAGLSLRVSSPFACLVLNTLVESGSGRGDGGGVELPPKHGLAVLVAVPLITFDVRR